MASLLFDSPVHFDAALDFDAVDFGNDWLIRWR